MSLNVRCTELPERCELLHACGRRCCCCEALESRRLSGTQGITTGVPKVVRRARPTTVQRRKTWFSLVEFHASGIRRIFLVDSSRSISRERHCSKSVRRCRAISRRCPFRTWSSGRRTCVRTRIEPCGHAPGFRTSGRACARPTGSRRELPAFRLSWLSPFSSAFHPPEFRHIADAPRRANTKLGHKPGRPCAAESNTSDLASFDSWKPTAG